MSDSTEVVRDIVRVLRKHKATIVGESGNAIVIRRLEPSLPDVRFFCIGPDGANVHLIAWQKLEFKS